MATLTVFTPAYNRAKLLERCYESMKRQTNKNFIWMIIDDGSVDNTRELAEGWVESEKNFSVEYYYKENGGKYTAYNEAIAHIETELCVCIDSDDYMPDDAVEKILSFWDENGSEEYAGIVGLDYYADGRGIVGGDPLPDQKSVNLIDLLIGKYPIHNGDRTDVVRTDLYKRFAPMKVFPGEKYFETHYLHLQISQTYDFLVMNENLRFVEYQEDGLSSNVFKLYRNSPNCFAETRKLYLSFQGTSLKFRFRHSIHLVSSCILAGKFSKVLRESPCPFITFLAIPFGVLLTLYILYKTKN
ncbi:MAG: glycosyltransferase family 2 protein [Lachnospiraceae bacterium]|nr:glycosyltransferase family 2 protein [Lachnospiraceae bacterium]